ncbi:armadillo-type protein [Mycena amicta]|nr:armadillo-type protein [Mycena amicta]
MGFANLALSVGSPSTVTDGKGVKKSFVEGDDSPFRRHSEEHAPVWSLYMDVAKNFDQDLASLFNSDLDSLLIFAGLFAGILSAFLIEIRKGLQEDLQSVTNNLLNVLIALQTNSTGSPPPPTPVFVAAASTRAINGLWFTSLTFGLLSALGASASKAWVTQLSVLSGSSWKDVSRHCGRLRGIQRWHLAALIQSLPLLLHIAFFLFGAGLVVLLFQDDPVIGYLTLALTGTVALLYLGNIIFSAIRLDSPYRTPLSKFIRRLFTGRKPMSMLSAAPSRSDARKAQALAWLLSQPLPFATMSEAIRAIAGLPFNQLVQKELHGDVIAAILCARLSDEMNNQSEDQKQLLQHGDIRLSVVQSNAIEYLFSQMEHVEADVRQHAISVLIQLLLDGEVRRNIDLTMYIRKLLAKSQDSVEGVRLCTLQGLQELLQNEHFPSGLAAQIAVDELPLMLQNSSADLRCTTVTLIEILVKNDKICQSPQAAHLIQVLLSLLNLLQYVRDAAYSPQIVETACKNLTDSPLSETSKYLQAIQLVASCFANGLFISADVLENILPPLLHCLSDNSKYQTAAVECIALVLEHESPRVTSEQATQVLENTRLVIGNADPLVAVAGFKLMRKLSNPTEHLNAQVLDTEVLLTMKMATSHKNSLVKVEGLRSLMDLTNLGIYTVDLSSFEELLQEFKDPSANVRLAALEYFFILLQLAETTNEIMTPNMEKAVLSMLDDPSGDVRILVLQNIHQVIHQTSPPQQEQLKLSKKLSSCSVMNIGECDMQSLMPS